MEQLSPAAAAALNEALAFARNGDLVAARARVEGALAAGIGHPALHALLGTICARADDPSTAVDHLRLAAAASPRDATIAANLAAALTRLGRSTEVTDLLGEEVAAADASGRLWRLRGYALQQSDRHDEAAEAYRAVVALHPNDAEAWNNLGNACAAAGDGEGSIAALRRASALAPESGPIQLNLAATLSALGRLVEAEEVLRARLAAAPSDIHALTDFATLLRHRHRDDEALAALERAVAAAPGNVELRVQLGEELATAWRFGEAEAVLREALTLDPGNAAAFVQLALILEHRNREDALPGLLAEAEAAGVEAGSLHFLRALACRRAERFEDGLAHVLATPQAVEPIRRAQLEGQFRDRLGDAAGAFAAFTRMNRLLADDPSDPVRRAEQFRSAHLAKCAAATRLWANGWRRECGSAPDAPVFLVGFPRSGTTLLDTMLLGHPDVQLLEERPPLQQVEDALGGYERLPLLGDREIAQLRERYWQAVAEHCAPRRGALLVDKQPLHMNKLPLIHRLFPAAKVILALRHPCDVVLSCFITSFRLNDAMATFLDLEATARFYNESFSYMERCRSLLPVQVREVRYEAMIADPAATLRPVFDWLGLAWNDAVLDHRRTARSRGLISTASYAQVTEPIYNRAAGRWQRYRAQLAPVLPLLAPWAARYGYAL